jgi:hypothetical protein
MSKSFLFDGINSVAILINFRLVRLNLMSLALIYRDMLIDLRVMIRLLKVCLYSFVILIIFN